MADRELTNKLSSGEILQIKIGGTASANIVPIQSDLDAIDADISALQDVGVSHMVATTSLTPQAVVATVAEKLTAFNTILHDIGTASTPSLVDQSFTIDEEGLFRVYGTIIVEAANNSTISLELRKNDVAISPAIILKSAGDPLPFTYISMFDLVATDVLTIWIKSSATENITVSSASVVVEKTSF